MLSFCVLTAAWLRYAQSESIQWIATSSDKSKAFERQTDVQTVDGTPFSSTLFTIDDSTEYQSMYGFGAALTQSAAYLLSQYKSRDSTAYWSLMDRLFNQSTSNDDSIAINILRYPMGASDFILPATQYFTYDDNYWDFDLSEFSLQAVETYEIPILQDILSINPDIKLILVPWSAPTWLKTSSQDSYPNRWHWGDFNDTGNNLQVYASYFVKTLNEYQSQYAIEFWAISMQNEPLNCVNSWIVMCMPAADQIKFINVLAPLLQINVDYDVKIMIYDHNWDNTDYAITVLSDSTAYNYVDFVAWHCYAGDVSAQSTVHDRFPNKEHIFTECTGTGVDDFYGNMQWNANNIWTGSVENWSGLVTHWNLVLDQNWDPHHDGACTNCRGIFEFDTSNNYATTFFEEYFGIGHYGKFVDPVYPAKRIASSIQNSMNCISGLAFKNSAQATLANALIVVVNNFCGYDVQIGVQSQSAGAYFQASVPAGMSTFLWAEPTSAPTTAAPTSPTTPTTATPTDATTAPTTTAPTSSVSVTALQWIVTTLDKSKQFERQTDITPMDGTTSLSTVFTIDPDTEYQSMYGFGAALTQSAAYLLSQYKSTDSTAYWSLMNQLFDQSTSNDDSIAINVIRFPMGASDFILPSNQYFTYDDTDWDFDLSEFSLQPAETYQIPILLDILSINPDIKVMLVPWSAPTWLKTSSQESYPTNWQSGSFNDTGNNLQVYANYFVKTLTEYQSQHGIEFWAISMQNSPLNCPNNWIVMCMSPQLQIKFINVLAPLIQTNVDYAVKIMIYDHNWDNTDYAITVLSDSTAYNYVDFVAWHCYAGDVSAQSTVHDRFPNKEHIFTECTGTGVDDFYNNMQWNANNIWTGSVENWSGLVTHWNLVLDQNSDPHATNACSDCRGIFQFDTSNGYAITQFEEYFGIGHYGKFVDPVYPAKRIGSSMQDSSSCVTGLAFANSAQATLANALIIVVNNFCSSSRQIAIQLQSIGYAEVTVPVGIATFLWPQSTGLPTTAQPTTIAPTSAAPTTSMPTTDAPTSMPSVSPFVTAAPSISPTVTDVDDGTSGVVGLSVVSSFVVLLIAMVIL